MTRISLFFLLLLYAAPVLAQAGIDAILPLDLKTYSYSINEENKFKAMIKHAVRSRSKDPLFYQANNAQKELARNPNDLAANEIMCDAYKRAGFMAAATKQCRNVLKINPDSSLAKTNIADMSFRQGKTDAAEQLLNQVLATDPNDSRANMVMAEIQKSRGHTQQGLALAQEAAKSDPSSATLTGLGNLQAGARQGAQAEHSYLQALTLDPNNAEALANLADYYASRGDIGRAEEFAQRAARSQNGTALSNFTLASSYERQNRLAEARVYYEKAVELDPNFALGLKSLGGVLLKSNEAYAALNVLQKAHQLTPHDAGIKNSIAQCYRILGNNQAAAQYETPQTQISAPQNLASLPAPPAPPGKQLRIEQAIHAESKGDLESARRIYESLAIEQPESADNFFNLARIYGLAQDWVNATRFYRHSLDLNPKLGMAYAELAKIDCFQGRKDAAWENYRSALGAGFIDKEGQNQAYLGQYCPLQQGSQ